MEGPKIFSQKRVDAHITSRIGNLFAQKREIPSNLDQLVCFRPKSATNDSSNNNDLFFLPAPNYEEEQNLKKLQNSWKPQQILDIDNNGKKANSKNNSEESQFRIVLGKRSQPDSENNKSETIPNHSISFNMFEAGNIKRMCHDKHSDEISATSMQQVAHPMLEGFASNMAEINNYQPRPDQMKIQIMRNNCDINAHSNKSSISF